MSEKKWWQMTGKQIAGDTEALEARHIAYFSTFYASPQGREVLADIEKEIWDEISENPVNMTASEHAIGCRFLMLFMETIKEKCGVTDRFEVICAEASISQDYKIPKANEQKKESMYD